MIRIIKDGKRPEKKKTIWAFICPECSCQFECEIEDFAKIEKRLNGDKSIYCPCCHYELHTNKDPYLTHEVTVVPFED